MIGITSYTFSVKIGAISLCILMCVTADVTASTVTMQGINYVITSISKT